MHFILMLFLLVSKQYTCEGSPGIFVSSNFWHVNDKPVLANGHIGFVPYGDAIYMNGLYNGFKGDSHRARIPNYANIQFEPCAQQTKNSKFVCSYALDIYNGVFRTQTQLNDGLFTVEQIQYAHRYYDTVLVNQIRVKRNQNTSNEKLQLHLHHINVTESDDLLMTSSRTINILNRSVTIVESLTKLQEDPVYQHGLTSVSVLREEIPNVIELSPGEDEIDFIWITIVQKTSIDIEETFRKVHHNPNGVLQLHANEWQTFWTEKQISAEGNDDLSNAIDASIYALSSALPSLNSYRTRAKYFGLSPAGLGLDRKLEVYNGHSFWDTEVWMYPSLLLLEPTWSKELLNYRYHMRNAARDNAINTNYEGYRFPWESAFTGVDVTLSDYPQIVKYQQHITADIGHALRKYFFATHDFEWFRSIGCDLSYGTAKFWASRVSWNATTHRYDINEIMGPDEDHYNINNNAYSNVVAALNLHFGTFASCFCHQLNPNKYPVNSTWSSIAKHITLLYDRQLDYNPEYDGYHLNIPIKQADVSLLGYPLQFVGIRKSTRRNNLNFYGNVTRLNGPAMTFCMHVIGHLEVDSEEPTEDIFNRTYIPYIRSPYFVWNEYVNGVPNGASNFITGAGGFLQLIIYGYAGIRINSDSLSVTNPKLPPNTKGLKLNSIAYMDALSMIYISQKMVQIDIRENRDRVDVYIDQIKQDRLQNLFEFSHAQTLQVKPKKNSFAEFCDLPDDTVDELSIN